MDINSKNISFFNQPQLHFSTDKGSWEKEKLGLNISLTTGKLDANASNENGEYAFFTCNKETLKTDTYAFDCDAILINGNGDLGFTRKYSGKFNAYQRTYVLTNFKHNFDYLEEVIKKYLPEKVLQEAFGGAMPYIRANTITNLDIYTPSMEVQEKVSYLLSNIEDKINKQEILLNKLKNTKAALLVKMFPQNNEDMPALRFAGFTNTWEQRKLSDLVKKITRKNTNNESDLPLTISSQHGLIDQNTFFNKRIASRNVSNYYLLFNGEFAYNKSSSDGYPFGSVKRLELYDKGVLSTLYIVFDIKNKEEIDSDFLTIFFETDRWYKGVSERATEGARNHGLLNISAEAFLDIDLFIPKSIQEQKEIASYFNNLNKTITLHQRKLDKLKEVKSALLDKLLV